MRQQVVRQDHGVGAHAQLASRQVPRRGLALGVGRRGEPVAGRREIGHHAGEVAGVAGRRAALGVHGAGWRPRWREKSCSAPPSG